MCVSLFISDVTRNVYNDLPVLEVLLVHLGLI